MLSFLQRRMFLPLGLASLLAMGLFFLEWQSRGWYGPRIYLNLALAWMPYLFAMAAVAVCRRNPDASLAPIPWLVLWFLFLPNAFYLMTDFVYLGGSQSDLWQRIGVFTSFALCGLMLGMVSLFYVHALVQGLWGRFAGWCMVVLAMALSGPGVYLGRFVRLNSWDVFTDPLRVTSDIAEAINDEVQGIRPVLFMATFSAIVLIHYYLVLSLRLSPPTREEIKAGRLVELD